MDNYSVVGKRIPHRDAVEKVKGSAVFASDIKLSGMLHGKILRSPVAHARIRNIDISKAAKLMMSSPKQLSGVTLSAYRYQLKPILCFGLVVSLHCLEWESDWSIVRLH